MMKWVVFIFVSKECLLFWLVFPTLPRWLHLAKPSQFTPSINIHNKAKQERKASPPAPPIIPKHNYLIAVSSLWHFSQTRTGLLWPLERIGLRFEEQSPQKSPPQFRQWCWGGGGSKIEKFIKKIIQKSTLVADNTQGLITTKQTKPSRFCSTASHHSSGQSKTKVISMKNIGVKVFNHELNKLKLQTKNKNSNNKHWGVGIMVQKIAMLSPPTRLLVNVNVALQLIQHVLSSSGTQSCITRTTIKPEPQESLRTVLPTSPWTCGGYYIYERSKTKEIDNIGRG